MNKNPFIPQPSFGHTQPPLPPGPPPQQPDYNAYWSAAAAVQQPPAGQPAYNPHFAASGWTAPQPAPPAKPPADQSSLYANYGYGGQQNLHWQQRQGHPPRPPQMTMVQSAPATYHPYQQQTQQAPYPPPPGFMPQPGMPPQPMAQQPYRPVQPPQPPYIAQPHPLPSRQPSMNHSSPQQLPPAKRQRFDHSQNAPQPRFQAPPPPPSLPQQPAAQGRSGQPGFGAPPTGPSNSFGSGRGGGMGGGRGGPGRGRGAIGGNRGGLVRGGRGGSMYGGGRGGNRNQGGAGLRGHQSRDRNNFENFNRGRGASFSGSFHGNGSFRSHGRSGGSGSNRNARNENHGSKLINSSSTVGNPANKKDENRRTLTDFKLVGLEIQNLDWRWGHVPSDPGTSQTKNVQVEEDPSSLIKEEPETDSKLPSMDTDERTPGSGLAHLNNLFSSSSLSATSRLRIYFHTLPSPDDARLSLQSSPMADTRKGKRKKLDDDGDGDYDGLPSFPLLNETEGGHHDSSASVDNNAGGLERGSAAPSVTETASEADWLMAAIAEGNDDGDEHYDDDHHPDGEHPHDGEMVDDDQMSEIAVTQADEPPLEGEHKEPDGDVHAAESQETEMGLEDADGEPDPEHMPEGETGSQEIPGLTRADDHAVNQSESHSQSEVIPGLSPILPADIDETQSEREHKSGSPTTHPLVAEPTLVLSENEPEIKVEDFTFSSQNAEDSVHSPPGESGAGEKSDRPVDESLPEPPDSTSTSNASAHNAESANPPAAAATRQPSANRLSISYANGLRRLVIDADIVEKMQVFRAESRIEVAMTIERVSDGFKGILVEALNEETKSYVAIQDLSEALESDDTLPPFWCFVFPTKTNLVVYLDKQRRLSEAKWVRSGDVQDWLKSMFGRMFWVAGDAVGWEKKIEVVDPEPTPTIQTVLEGWSSVSPVGSLTERQRFVKTHLSESENTLEILLRLVRGERATPFSSQTTATANTLGFTGPLQNALNLSTHHASQQTHVSLAVLAIVKMALDFAEKTVETNEKAKGDVMERMGEIIKSLPSHLLYKSLDGMFKEWKADKKGGR